MLLDAELQLDGHTIIAIAKSSLAENAIRTESGLIEHIRRHFGQSELTFTIKRSARPPEVPKVQKILSSKEKYLVMRETNPVLQELQARFDLRPDED